MVFQRQSFKIKSGYVAKNILYMICKPNRLKRKKIIPRFYFVRICNEFRGRTYILFCV